MNEFSIPTSCIQSVTFEKRYDANYARIEDTMTISLNPDAGYAFCTDEWIRQDDVAKNYWSKKEVSEMLYKRANSLRIQAGNHGAKARYAEANRLQSRAAELESIAKNIDAYARFSVEG